MIKTFMFLMFIVFVGSLFYLVNEQTKDLPDINTLLGVENTTVNNVTLPKFNLNLGNTAPSLAFVSATEYTKGDGNGSTIIKLMDWRGEKINTTCWETILYPDKTTFVNWTLMTQHWEYGNYYMNFVVPEPLGIYDQEVRCVVSSKNISIGKGFHVGNLSAVINASTEDTRVDIMTVMS